MDDAGILYLRKTKSDLVFNELPTMFIVYVTTYFQLQKINISLLLRMTYLRYIYESATRNTGKTAFDFANAELQRNSLLASEHVA